VGQQLRRDRARRELHRAARVDDDLPHRVRARKSPLALARSRFLAGARAAIQPRRRADVRRGAGLHRDALRSLEPPRHAVLARPHRDARRARLARRAPRVLSREHAARRAVREFRISRTELRVPLERARAPSEVRVSAARSRRRRGSERGVRQGGGALGGSRRASARPPRVPRARIPARGRRVRRLTGRQEEYARSVVVAVDIRSARDRLDLARRLSDTPASATVRGVWFSMAADHVQRMGRAETVAWRTAVRTRRRFPFLSYSLREYLEELAVAAAIVDPMSPGDGIRQIWRRATSSYVA